MTRLLLSLAAALAVALPASAQTTLLSESFETDGNPARYTTSIPEANENDDYFARATNADVDQTYTGPDGTFFFAVQDIDGLAGNPSPTQSLTFDPVDITGFSVVTFSALFAEGDDGANQDYDNVDHVRVFASVDGGGEFQIFGIENDGSTFNSAPFVDTDFDGVGDGAEITDTFTSYSASIGQTGSSLVLRIEFQLDSGDEDIAIDLVEVVGSTGPATTVTTSSAIGWRLLSVPTATTVDDLAQINLVSGAAGYTEGTRCQVNAITNLFTAYNGDPSSSNGGYSAPADGATIQPGEGFFWYFFGETPGANEPTSCMNGLLTSTTQALPLTFSASGMAPSSAATVGGSTANADGFYMLGNPFEVAFDLDGLSAFGATIQAGAQAWDPEINDYRVFTADGSDLTSADDDDVSIWQGFFVETDATMSAPTFNFSTAAAQAGVEGDGFAARSASAFPMLSFEVTDGTLTGAAAVVRFDETATAAWDRFDLSKLDPFAFRFAQIGPVGLDRDGALVTKAVESRPRDLVNTVEIPLAFATSEETGTFTLSWPTAVLPAEWAATVTDLVTGETVDLTTASELVFEHSASAPADRFVLTVTGRIVAEEAGAEAFALGALAPNPTAGVARMALTVEGREAVRVTVYDALGRTVATVLDDVIPAGATRSIAVPTAGLAAGTYAVRVEGTTFAATRRLTVTR